MPLAGSPLGLGLGSLGSILAGVGQGTTQADLLGQHQRMLDLTQRAQDLQNEARTTDVAPLFQALGLQLPAGTGRVATPIAGELAKIAEARRLQDVEQQRRGQLAGTVEGMAPTNPHAAEIGPLLRSGAITPADLMKHLFPQAEYGTAAPGTTPFSKQTGLPPAGVTPTPMKPKVDIKQGPDGYYAISTDALTGEPIGPAQKIPGIGAPESRGVYTRSDIEDQLRLEGQVPGTLAHRQRYNDLARQVMVGPGGAVVGAGTGLQPSAPAAQPGGPPVLAQRPPIPTAAETQQAADPQTWIKQARQASTDLATYLQAHPNPQDRLSYAGRIKLQSSPLVGSIAWTTPEEQKLAAEIGNLQIAWERASGGLRMASSPQMQERIRSIFGNPTNAATPQHLLTVADQMEQEIQQRAATEQQAGRPAIAVPPGGIRQPSPAPAPTGNRIRVRSKANPSRMGWIEQGEPIPPDVEVVR